MNNLGGKSLFNVKGMFFDKALLTSTMDKTKLAFLSRAGAFVTTSAKRSIRKGKKPSEAGKPPKGHGQQLLRKFIFFALDRKNEECLVGPVQLNQVNYTLGAKPAKGTIPSVLETGGEVWYREVFKHGKWQRANQVSRQQLNGLPVRLRRKTVAARPFMGPALAVNVPKFAGLMRGLFKKG